MSSSIERLRAERLQREAEERRRAQALVDQRSGKRKQSERELNERERPYNSAFFPELARKRQRRDRDSWRDEILKSWSSYIGCLKTVICGNLLINVSKRSRFKKPRGNTVTGKSWYSTTLRMCGYHDEATSISCSSICIYFHEPKTGNACTEVGGRVQLQLPLCLQCFPHEPVIRQTVAINNCKNGLFYCNKRERKEVKKYIDWQCQRVKMFIIFWFLAVGRIKMSSTYESSTMVWLIL